MGVVYKARQTRLNRVVALKMILAGDHAGADDLARFKTEAEAIARLHHPNIVQIFEVGDHKGLPFLSLEFCTGGSLAARLKHQLLPPREAAQLVETLARAVQAAHEEKVIHRDLKPANVLLAASPGTPAGAAPPANAVRLTLGSYTLTALPKITDFGLAKKLDEAAGQTQSGAVMGTPSYMAPEQAGGKVREIGPSADVYALGAILYELLTGRPPFRAATSLDTILQVLTKEPVPVRALRPAVPCDLETICLKCLQKATGQRYASAAALADDLERFLRDEPIQARPVGRLERGWRWCRRNPVVAALTAGAAALFVIAAVAVVLNMQQSREGEEVREIAQAAVDELGQTKGKLSQAVREQAAKEEAQRKQAWENRRRAYPEDMRTAWLALDQNRLDEARDLLGRHRPVPGQEDYRCWEWFYLDGILQQTLFAGETPSTKRGNFGCFLQWSPDGRLLASRSHLGLGGGT
jgi:hypothetical protein